MKDGLRSNNDSKNINTLRQKADDLEAGFKLLDSFERFNQKNDVFRRSWWDDKIRNKKTQLFYETYREPLKTWRKADGFNKKDYALRNASWHVSDIFTELKEDQDRREGFSDAFTLYRNVAETQQDMGSPKEAASELKRVAKGFGADLVGITQNDSRWTYTKKFSDMSQTERPVDIPEELNNVIVTIHAMDYDLIRTVPSALSGAATGLGYSHDALVTLGIAQYIRNLGYNAIASMNDSSLNIPLAIKAGLGEYGRLGLLITKEFGPRVRIGKVYTDIPLAPDQPINFGVKEFCEQCQRCSSSCPVKAISPNKPSAEVHNQSNIKGVVKWTVDGEKCFSYWAAQNSDCAVCMRVCPYNKDYSKPIHRIARTLASTKLRGIMLRLDKILGYGKRMKPKQWWSAKQTK